MALAPNDDLTTGPMLTHYRNLAIPAALGMLSECAGEVSRLAEVWLHERFPDHGFEEEEPPETFPGPEAGLGVATIPTEIARRTERDVSVVMREVDKLYSHRLCRVLRKVGPFAGTRQALQELADQQVQIAQFERRISKLTSSLEMTEDELKRVAAAKNIDLGVSSRYRTVQGVSSSDENYETKKELMSSIFQANLELQKGKGKPGGG